MASIYPCSKQALKERECVKYLVSGKIPSAYPIILELQLRIILILLKTYLDTKENEAITNPQYVFND